MKPTSSKQAPDPVAQKRKNEEKKKLAKNRKEVEDSQNAALLANKSIFDIDDSDIEEKKGEEQEDHDLEEDQNVKVQEFEKNQEKGKNLDVCKNKHPTGQVIGLEKNGNIASDTSKKVKSKNHSFMKASNCNFCIPFSDGEKKLFF